MKAPEYPLRLYRGAGGAGGAGGGIVTVPALRGVSGRAGFIVSQPALSAATTRTLAAQAIKNGERKGSRRDITTRLRAMRSESSRCLLEVRHRSHRCAPESAATLDIAYRIDHAALYTLERRHALWGLRGGLAGIG